MNTNCQWLWDSVFFVVSIGPSLEHLFMIHPPPHFSMAQADVSWTYQSLVYWGCSSCPLIIKMLSLFTSKPRLCTASHRPVGWQPYRSKLFIYFFSLQMAQYMFELYYNFPKGGFHHSGLCWMPLLDSHLQLNIAFGEAKWRHVNENIRSVLHVAHTVSPCFWRHGFTSGGLLWHDN